MKKAYNLPIFLFLCGILAYGGCFARHTTESFDLTNIIRDGNVDDAFYYHRIARNLAEGKFSTFDGGITRTNGYHPLWMLLITPLHWAFDPIAALFAVKAFEIMLIAGGVACIAAAAWLGHMPWILLFALPPLFYMNIGLLLSMEPAAALFMLGLLFLVLGLYARNPARWKRPLAAVLFFLPWARLEYMAVSLAASGVLCLIEHSLQKSPDGGRRTLFRRLYALDAAGPLLAAVAGILAYFAYNGLVFGGIVPVSGAVKAVMSQAEISSLTQNFHDVRQMWIFAAGLPAALEICAWFAFFWWSAHRSRRRRDYLSLIFMAGAFSLAAGHLGKFAQTVVTTVPRLTDYMWYFVPAYLLTALLIPIRCYAAVQCVRRFIEPQRRQTATMAVVLVGAAILWAKTDFMSPFRYVSWKRDSTLVYWNNAAYAAAQVTNRVLPEGSVIGSVSAGVIGYFSRFPVVNLDGLVNDYDYFQDWRENWLGGGPKMNAAYFSSKFGITHLVNSGTFTSDDTRALLAVGPTHGSSDMRIVVSAAEVPESLSDLSAKAAWFWERMDPYFDYRFGDAAVLLSGRLAQVFGRECGTRDRPGELLRVSLAAAGSGTPAEVWHLWAEGENMPGGCTDAFMLPRDFPKEDLRVSRFAAERFLGHFEDGLDGWRVEGEAVTNHADHAGSYNRQSPIYDNIGPGFLTSFHPDKRDEPAGRALSPEFTAVPGQYLAFLLAGGRGEGVGLRLLADGEEAELWRGKNSNRFELTVYSLDAVAGKRLQLELFDRESGGWGHIMLDHVVLMRQWRAQDGNAQGE